MATILLAFLAHKPYTTLAAPITALESQIVNANGNTTILQSEIAPGWATTSNVRSTSDLLWSCVLTLSICVYTVIHINIPPPNESSLQFYLRKTKWVLIAIFAPEISLLAAYQQWSTARQLKAILNKYRDQATKNSTEQKEGSALSCEFGMTYCFYAVMGGFAVDVSHIHDYLSQVIIQPQGLAYLAKKGHFIEMPENAIQDKSKADVLAKLLVCVQVTWMVIQCIGRKAAGYPISLLEIHVLVHVACALCMYALWIKKPLDIRNSTPADSSPFQEDLALILLESSCCKNENSLHLYNIEDTASDQSALGKVIEVAQSSPTSLKNNLGSGDAEASTITHRSPVYEITETKDSGRRSDVHSDEPARICTIKPGQSLSHGLGLSAYSTFQVKLSAKDVLRWNMAAKAMKRDTETYKAGKREVGKLRMISRHCANIQNYIFRVDLTERSQLAIMESFRGGWLPGLLLPIFYGGIHLSAWNFDFPSPVEHKMWKGSCLTIMFSVFAGLIDAMISSWIEETIKLLFPNNTETMDTLSLYFLGFSIVLIFVFTSCARLFLVVESFISVRRLPIGVYTTVNWSNYIPHL